MDNNLDTICWHLKRLRDNGEAPAEIEAAFRGLDDRLTRIERDLADLMQERPRPATAARQAANEIEQAFNSLNDFYRELCQKAWFVCQEHATLAPTAALLALLRQVQPHLGSVPPTCGCDACALERQIEAALHDN